MRSRCFNPRFEGFKYYGARGIDVCERWASFANFIADMGERPEGHSLDRIDCDGNYEPGNCRWATPKVQRMNQRRMKRWLSFECVAEAPDCATVTLMVSA